MCTPWGRHVTRFVGYGFGSSQQVMTTAKYGETELTLYSTLGDQHFFHMGNISDTRHDD